MPRQSPYDQFCPIARTLDIVGDRWTLLIIREFHLGPLRYSDLSRALPRISTDVLADRLRKLTAAQLIENRPDGSYRITASGRTHGPLLREMLRWGGAHLDSATAPVQRNLRLAVVAVILNAEPDSGRAPKTIQLQVGDLLCHVTLDSAGAFGGMGEAAAPDAVVVTDPNTFEAVALGSTPIASAIETGALAVTGDAAAASSLLVDIGMPESMRSRSEEPNRPDDPSFER